MNHATYYRCIRVSENIKRFTLYILCCATRVPLQNVKEYGARTAGCNLAAIANCLLETCILQATQTLF